MQLNRTIKILLGLATGAYTFSPLIFIPVWLLAFFSATLGANYRGDPPPVFFFALFSMFPLICLFNLLHFVLLPVYLIHIIKNKSGSDAYRILSGIGLFFFPWLAMPIYYFVYVWPDQPPIWALAPGAPSNGETSSGKFEVRYYDPSAEASASSKPVTTSKNDEMQKPTAEAKMNEALAGSPPADPTIIQPGEKDEPEAVEKPATKKPRRRPGRKATTGTSKGSPSDATAGDSNLNSGETGDES